MLPFFAEFPLSNTSSAHDCLDTLEPWIEEATPGLVPRGELAKALSGSTVSIRNRFASIEAIGHSSDDEESIGVRHVRRNGEIDWIHSIVYSKSDRDVWISVRATAEAANSATWLPSPRKPAFINALIEDLGGGADGDFTTRNKPFYFEDSDIDRAARIVRNTSGARLPIVFVTARGAERDYIVSCEQLADVLSGMAHVVAEPNRFFAQRLRMAVNSENVYGGTVALYWPENNARRTFYMGPQFPDSEQIFDAIVDEIRNSSANIRPLQRCRWESVRDAAGTADRAPRSTSSPEDKKRLDALTKELEETRKKLNESQREIEALEDEIDDYRGRVTATSKGLLSAGTERQFLPDESFNAVREALEDAVHRADPDSRRYHLLADILRSNPARSDSSNERRESIKQLLRGFSALDARIRRGLESLGFTVYEEGKHYKLLYNKDDRYTFTLPRSGSDSRGGLNAAGDIARLLF